MTFAPILRFLGIKPRNPMLSDPRYRALMNEERERRRRHQSVRSIQKARRALVHQALRGAK